MYQLIAFDMDGTLLGSDKQISPGNRRAITAAARAGKTVILNTGRCLSELEEYLGLIPEVRYLNCASGALVYDLKEKRTLYSSLLSVETVKQLLKLAALEQAMPHILLEQCIVQKSHCEQMERFGMEMCIRDSVILSEAESVFAAGRNGPQIGVCNLRLRKCKARLVVFNGRLD